MGDELILRVKAAVDAAISDLEKLGDTVKRTSKEMERDFERVGTADVTGSIDDQLRNIAVEARRAATELRKDFGQSADQVSRDLRKVGSEADRARRELQQTGKVDFSRLISASRQADRELARVATTATRVGKTSGLIDTLTGAFRRLQGGLATLGIALGVRELIRFGAAAVETGLAFQRLELGLKAITGSAENAQKALGFLNGISERLGLNVLDLAANYNRMAAAFQRNEVLAGNLNSVFQIIAESARVMGLETTRVNLTMEALSQIAGKGVLSMEELRRQLGDNLPQAAGIIAEQLGITTSQLFKLTSEGVVPAETAILALAKGLRDQLGPSVEEATQRTGAVLGRLTREVQLAQKAFSEGLQPGLRQAAEALSLWLQQNNDAVRSMGEVAGGVLRLTDGVLGFIEAIRATKDAYDVFDANNQALVLKLQNSIAQVSPFIDAETKKWVASEFEAAKQRLAIEQESLDRRLDSAAIFYERARGLGSQRVEQESEDAERIRKLEADLAEARKKLQESLTDTTDKEAKKRAAAEKKALNETVDAFAKASDLIKEILAGTGTFAEPAGAGRGAQRAGDAAREAAGEVEKLRAELEELRRTTFLDPEQLNRLNALPALIFDAEAAARRAGQEIPSALSQVDAGFADTSRTSAAALKILEALFKNADSLAAQLGGPTAQALLGAASDLERVARAGLATESDIRAFAATMQTLGVSDVPQASRAVDSFAAALEAQARAVRDTGAAAAEAGGGIIQMGDQVQVVGDASKASAEALLEAKDAVGEVGKAAEEAGSKIIGPKGEVIELGKAAGDASKAMSELGGTITTPTGEVIRLGDAAAKSADQLPAAADGTRKLGEAAAEAQEPVAAVATASERQATAMQSMAETAPTVAETLPQIFTGLAEQQEAIAAVSESFVSIAESMTSQAETGPQVAEALGSITEAITTMVEQREALAELVVSLEDLGVKGEESLGKLTTAAGEADEKLAGVRDRLQELGDNEDQVRRIETATSDAKTATADWLEQLENLQSDGLQPVIDLAPEVESSLDGIGTNIGRIREETEDATNALKTFLALALEGLPKVESALAGIRDRAQEASDALTSAANAAERLGSIDI